MDKFLITAFRADIANAILNSQDKLNPDGDAYISEKELPAVLDFFGAKSVDALLKPTDKDSNNSIFTKQEKPEENKNFDMAEFNDFMDTNKRVLRDDGSAAYELQNSTASDLMTSYQGTPYEAQMKSLYEYKKHIIKSNGDTSVIDAKISALNEAVQEYIKMHQQDVTKALAENGAVKSFQYGKDGTKKGYYIQTFGVKANNTMNGSDSADIDSSEDSDTDISDAQDTEISSDKNSGAGDTTTSADNDNKAVGGITYNIEVVTDKLHAIGHIDADSENSDISAVAVYSNESKNGAKLNFSGNFRQTIEKNNNRTNIGASFDYVKKNFSTGGYGVYEREENDDSKIVTKSVEGYARYGKTLRAAVGYAHESSAGLSSAMTYMSAKVSGKREVNKNITLIGSVAGSYGVATADFGDEQKERLPVLNVNASGGLTFKSDNSDFSANILANVDVDREKNLYNEYATSVTSTLLGNVSNEKLDVTATLTSMNHSALVLDENTKKLSDERKTNWSSSVTVGLKKLFGQNVVPSFTYNLNCDDKVKHNIAVNLGINF